MNHKLGIALNKYTEHYFFYIKEYKYAYRGRGQMRGLPLEVRERRRVVSHVREHQAFFVVVLAQDLVVAQVEPVAHAEP